MYILIIFVVIQLFIYLFIFACVFGTVGVCQNCSGNLISSCKFINALCCFKVNGMCVIYVFVYINIYCSG